MITTDWPLAIAMVAAAEILAIYLLRLITRKRKGEKHDVDKNDF